MDIAAVGLAVDPQVARGRALVDRRQQAGPKPPPARVVFLDVQRAGAELEDPLRAPGSPRAGSWPGERAVELDPRIARLAREVDPREILAGGDLKVGKGLVILEVVVVLGLDVLDQPGFHQAGHRPRCRPARWSMSATSSIQSQMRLSWAAVLWKYELARRGGSWPCRRRSPGPGRLSSGRGPGWWGSVLTLSAGSVVGRCLGFRHGSLAGSNPSWCLGRRVRRLPVANAIPSDREARSPGASKGVCNVLFDIARHLVKSAGGLGLGLGEVGGPFHLGPGKQIELDLRFGTRGASREPDAGERRVEDQQVSRRLGQGAGWLDLRPGRGSRGSGSRTPR